MPKAYSYVRFSTPEQAQGDSFRRQAEAAAAYAKAHKLTLDTELTFADLGVSAFRGKNVGAGQLGAFITAVDAGKVERGSYLLIENLDRLSRDEIRTARDRFEEILDRGINIVTLTDGRVYRADSYDMTDMLLTLLTMARAHEESKIKSQRISAAWANKKGRAASDKKVMTASVKAWLRVVDGKIEPIPERAEVVRRMFAMTLEGHGYVSITRQLNAEGVPTFTRSNGWHHAYIFQILRSEAVYGRFQPYRDVHEHGKRKRVPDGPPIDGYYPEIIPRSVFEKVQDMKPGATAKRAGLLPRNALSGLCFCGKCGERMHLISKGGPAKVARDAKRKRLPRMADGTPYVPDYTYLACDGARRLKLCDAPSVAYQPVLREVLVNLPVYLNAHVAALPTDDEMDGKINAVDSEIVKVQESISRLLDLVETAGVSSDEAGKRLAQNESKLTELKAQKAGLEKQMAANRPADGDWAAFTKWYDQPVEPDQLGDVIAGEVLRMHAEFKRVIDRIVIEKGQTLKVELRSGLKDTHMTIHPKSRAA